MSLPVVGPARFDLCTSDQRDVLVAIVRIGRVAAALSLYAAGVRNLDDQLKARAARR